MDNFIILMIFIGVLLISLITAAILYFKNKGIEASDEDLVKEMYDRQLISKEDFDKTMELKIKK